MPALDQIRPFRSLNRTSALVLVGCSLAIGLSAILAASISDLRILAVSVAFVWAAILQASQVGIAAYQGSVAARRVGVF